MRFMRKRWRLGLLVLPVLLGMGCGPREALSVRQFTLKDIDPNIDRDPLVRAERRKRLYGAISRQDREDRKGQYYSVRWRASANGGPVRLRFDYRQAATGSRELRLEHRLPAAGEGVAEFSVTGESYQQGGRVLAWRLRLFQDGNLLGEQKSFLWD